MAFEAIVGASPFEKFHVKLTGVSLKPKWYICVFMEYNISIYVYTDTQIYCDNTMLPKKMLFSVLFPKGLTK